MADFCLAASGKRPREPVQLELQSIADQAIVWPPAIRLHNLNRDPNLGTLYNTKTALFEAFAKESLRKKHCDSIIYSHQGLLLI